MAFCIVRALCSADGGVVYICREAVCGVLHFAPRKKKNLVVGGFAVVFAVGGRKCSVIQFGGEDICLLGGGEGGVIKIVVEPFSYAARGVVVGIVSVCGVVPIVIIIRIYCIAVSLRVYYIFTEDSPVLESSTRHLSGSYLK